MLGPCNIHPSDNGKASPMVLLGVLLALVLGVSCRSVQQGNDSVSRAATTPAPTPLLQSREIAQPSKPKTKPPYISAKAAILTDQRGRVLFEKNADLRLPTASTQKLLLGMLISESGRLHEYITVTASDTHCQPTKLGIQPGQVYRKSDLLKAVLVRSSNDLARCLARHHSGSVSSFAQAMNRRAKQLGMHNSYFTNASGLPTPGGQYSTARDMSILGWSAMRVPTIRDAVRTKSLVFRFSTGSTKTLYNTNQVLKSNPYCIGCKTGYTKAAGRCLVSSATDGRRTVVAVVLGSKIPEIWSESDALLRYGLQQ